MPKKYSIIVALLMLISFAGGIKLQQHLAVPQPTEKHDDTREDAQYLREETSVTAQPGDKSIDFELGDIDGKPRRLSDWAGKIRVINFWATWCPPCLEEVPLFIQLQKEFSDHGLQFIGIGMNSAEEILSWTEKLAIEVNYPLLVGETEAFVLGSRYGNRKGVLPYTIIIDSEGVITNLHTGPLDRSQLLSLLLPLILPAAVPEPVQ